MWTSRLASGAVWRRLRSPFPLPYCLAGHCCDGHWELVDVDMAGCRLCGRLHLCSHSERDIEQARRRFNRSKESDQRENMDSCCRRVECDDGVVCGITGCCVEQCFFSEKEFVDTATIDMPASPRAVTVDYDDTLRHVRRILCSAESRSCLRQENTRVRLKMSHMFQRVLREYKIRNPGVAPNLCTLVAVLAHRAQNIRLCCQNFNAEQRHALAEQCCRAITHLINMLTRLCPSMLAQSRRETLIVGLLYLMRSGLVVHGTFILPRVQALQRMLPLESYLHPYFGIRCNSVTEIENLIKMQARTLTPEQVVHLGVHLAE